MEDIAPSENEQIEARFDDLDGDDNEGGLSGAALLPADGSEPVSLEEEIAAEVEAEAPVEEEKAEVAKPIEAVVAAPVASDFDYEKARESAEAEAAKPFAPQAEAAIKELAEARSLYKSAETEFVATYGEGELPASAKLNLNFQRAEIARIGNKIEGLRAKQAEAFEKRLVRLDVDRAIHDSKGSLKEFDEQLSILADPNLMRRDPATLLKLAKVLKEGVAAVLDVDNRERDGKGRFVSKETEKEIEASAAERTLARRSRGAVGVGSQSGGSQAPVVSKTERQKAIDRLWEAEG